MVRKAYRKGSIDRRGVIESKPPEISDARVDVVLQRIEERLGDELKVVPQHVRRFGVNNIFQRTLSYLFAWKSDGQPIKLAATLTGAMKVASVGAGLEKTELKTGTATNTLSTEIVFGQVISRIDVVVDTYQMYLYPSPDNATFYEPVLCVPGIHNIFDLSIKAFKVQNAELNDVDYYVLGEW